MENITVFSRNKGVNMQQQIIENLELKMLNARLAIGQGEEIPSELVQVITGYPSIAKLEQEKDPKLRKDTRKNLLQAITQDDQNLRLSSKVRDWHKNRANKNKKMVKHYETQIAVIKHLPSLSNAVLQYELVHAEKKIYDLVKIFLGAHIPMKIKRKKKEVIEPTLKLNFNRQKWLKQVNEQIARITIFEYLAKEQGFALNRVYFEGAIEALPFGQEYAYKKLLLWKRDVGNSGKSGNMDERFARIGL